MFDKEYLERLKKSRAHWETEVLNGKENGSNDNDSEHFTDSRIPVKSLYTPLDLEESGFDYLED